MGRAYGNIGNAYSAAGFYEQAIKYHKQELTISKEVHDRSSEASTHGNLAVAYQALGAHDMALFHYRAHLGKSGIIKNIETLLQGFKRSVLHDKNVNLLFYLHTCVLIFTLLHSVNCHDNI